MHPYLKNVVNDGFIVKDLVVCASYTNTVALFRHKRGLVKATDCSNAISLKPRSITARSRNRLAFLTHTDYDFAKTISVTLWKN